MLARPPNNRTGVPPVAVTPATPGDTATPGGAQGAVPVEVLGTVEVPESRPASRGGILAFTGTDVESLVRTALVVVALGGALLLTTRRGRRVHRVAR